jgi:predicted nucleic acid-binding protein
MSDPRPSFAVDANVLLRYVLRDEEELAQRARHIWQAVERAQIVAVLDPVILSEVVLVMSRTYGLSNEEIAEALTSMVELDHVVMVAKPRYVRALRLFGHSVKHFGDACACACALEECEGRLYSFDRKLSAVPGVQRREEWTG